MEFISTGEFHFCWNTVLTCSSGDGISTIGELAGISPSPSTFLLSDDCSEDGTVLSAETLGLGSESSFSVLGGGELIGVDEDVSSSATTLLFFRSDGWRESLSE
ncbi:MAG: hypothetical protein KME11_21580 [Timaviella obliquedivisa GSE-PSE-MK23-08B]|nr:hypothetical protein [Timaviella obliquedivisa GSE-PSE-MK23-08B]